MDNLCNDCYKVTLHKCRRRRQSKRRIPSVRASIPDELAQLITQLIDDEVNYVKVLKDFLHMEDVYRMDVPFSQRNNLLFESPSFLLPIYKLHQNYLLPLLKTVQTCDQYERLSFGSLFSALELSSTGDAAYRRFSAQSSKRRSHVKDLLRQTEVPGFSKSQLEIYKEYHRQVQRRLVDYTDFAHHYFKLLPPGHCDRLKAAQAFIDLLRLKNSISMQSILQNSGGAFLEGYDDNVGDKYLSSFSSLFSPDKLHVESLNNGEKSSESQEGVLLKNLLLAAHEITECLLDISFIKRHIPDLDPKLRSTLFGHSVAHETAVEDLAVLFRCWLEPSIRACGVLKLPSCGVKEIAENFQKLLIEPGTAFFRVSLQRLEAMESHYVIRPKLMGKLTDFLKKFEENFDCLLFCFLRYCEDMDVKDPLKIPTFNAVIDVVETFSSLKSFKFNDEDIIEIDGFGNVHLEDENDKLYRRIDDFGFRVSEKSKFRELIEDINLKPQKNEIFVKRRSHCEKLCKEILSTEKKYISDLTEICTLKRKFEKHRKMKNSHETRILFGAPGSLERILLLHDGIVEPLLKIAVSQIGSNGFVLGRLFSILKPDEFIFSIYEDFFKQQNDRTKIIERLLDEVRVDDAFSKHHLMSLNSKIIVLMQRLTRYDILFRDYLKCMPENHFDHEDAREALEKIRKMVKKINELVRVEQHHEHKKMLIEKYGHILAPKKSKVLEIMRWELYKYGKVDCPSINKTNVDLVIIQPRNHRDSGDFYARISTEQMSEENLIVFLGEGNHKHQKTHLSLPGTCLMRASVSPSSLKYEKSDFPKVLIGKPYASQNFGKIEMFDHTNCERKGFRLKSNEFCLDLVASDYNDWIRVFESELFLEKISHDPSTSGIVGRSAPRAVWPCIVSKCWTCGEKSESFLTCDCCGGAQCSKCPLEIVTKLEYESGEKDSSKICSSCKEKITAFELIGPATLKKAQALSIYIKHDYIMPYDEMFERAECCGILPVRVNSHHNKLHLISNKFSRRWVALLNYSNDGINSFWAVLIRNSPGDHPRFDAFLSEIRPETEFKQDRSSKEFSYSSPKNKVTFFLDSHTEQQIWCDAFRRAYQKASKSRQSRNPTVANSEFDSENSSGRDSHRNSLII